MYILEIEYQGFETEEWVNDYQDAITLAKRLKQSGYLVKIRKLL
jgi:hypothetical protein